MMEFIDNRALDCWQLPPSMASLRGTVATKSFASDLWWGRTGIDPGPEGFAT